MAFGSDDVGVVGKFGGEGVDDLHGLDAHADDLADESDDVLGIVFAIGVGGDVGAGVGAELVLVDDPFEGGAVAEADDFDIF